MKMRTKRKNENTMSCKTLVACALLLLVFKTAEAQNSSETRSFMKTFPVGRENTLELTNKYGTVQVTTWKKDSAYIRAEIKAYAPSQDKLTSMFDGVTISFAEAGSVVKAQTVFTQNINRLFESFKGMTSKIISYDSKIEINYYVNVPEYLNLKIDNRYGDLYMESCTGKLSASVSNGSFKANSLGKESSVTLSFCDAAISSISSGTIDASFSEISADYIGDVSINSISSKFDLKKAGRVLFESKRDKFTINTIESMRGNSYFTDFNVNDLKKELSLTNRYGNITTETIDKGFESINLNSGYADIFLNFAENSSYNLDVRHINTFLALPSKNSKTEQKTLDEEKKEYVTFGTVGSSPGSVKVKIDANRCKIYIK
jgi:hypothetical protein